MSLAAFAPVPDFRYVGLEPIPARKLGAAATAFGLGAGVTLALSGIDTKHALFAGVVASILSGFALRGAASREVAIGSARMRIVPWGVLVDADETPRILRWAAVRRLDVVTSRVSSRVVVTTEHDRFVGETPGAARLDRLVENLDAYAEEQGAPLALDLDGARALDEGVLGPECESLLACAFEWLEGPAGTAALDLPPAGYRRASSHTPTARAIEVLRAVLRDRTPKPADPRAFAAVVAAEVHATALVPELVTLTQCPHPLVAAIARLAARKLGASRAKTGTLDEVAPFLFDADIARLERWEW